MTDEDNKGTAAQIGSGASFPCTLLSSIFGLILAIYSTVVSTNMLNDPDMQNFSGCNLLLVGQQLRIYGILEFVVIAISLIMLVCGVMSQVSLCVGKSTENPLFSFGGLCCSCTMICFALPIMAASITAFVFYILINVNFWGGTCAAIIETEPVVATFFPIVKGFMITTYVFLGIPAAIVGVILALLPIIVCVIVVIVICCVTGVATNQGGY